MGSSILQVIGLVLIIEGLMPLLAPGQWRSAMSRIAQFNDGQLRFVGLLALLMGLLLILV